MRLYEKVSEFDRIALQYRYGSNGEGSNHYIGEDIENVFEEFSRIFSISLDLLEPLKDSMKSGFIDFLSLPRGEAPACAAPFSSEEILPLLYVLSRPFFKSLGKSTSSDHQFWSSGRCPECGSVPAISVLDEGRSRKLYCSFCGTMGNYKRISCPYCHNEDSSLFDIIYLEEHEGLRSEACNSCRSYIKTAESLLPSKHTIEEIDLLSLPFDIVMQNNGYTRRSPNPVGYTRLI
jgi:transcription elongation factor Elf1